jgi:hypothetical protein
MTPQAIPMMSRTIASVSVWMIASNVVILSCSRDGNWTTRIRRETGLHRLRGMGLYSKLDQKPKKISPLLQGRTSLFYDYV